MRDREVRNLDKKELVTNFETMTASLLYLVIELFLVMVKSQTETEK